MKLNNQFKYYSFNGMIICKQHLNHSGLPNPVNIIKKESEFCTPFGTSMTINGSAKFINVDISPINVDDSLYPDSSPNIISASAGGNLLLSIPIQNNYAHVNFDESYYDDQEMNFLRVDANNDNISMVGIQIGNGNYFKNDSYDEKIYFCDVDNYLTNIVDENNNEHIETWAKANNKFSVINLDILREMYPNSTYINVDAWYWQKQEIETIYYYYGYQSAEKINNLRSDDVIIRIDHAVDENHNTISDGIISYKTESTGDLYLADIGSQSYLDSLESMYDININERQDDIFWTKLNLNNSETWTNSYLVSKGFLKKSGNDNWPQIFIDYIDQLKWDLDVGIDDYSAQFVYGITNIGKINIKLKGNTEVKFIPNNNKKTILLAAYLSAE